MQRGLERIERRETPCKKIYYLTDFIVIAREEYKYCHAFFSNINWDDIRVGCGGVEVIKNEVGVDVFP